VASNNAHSVMRLFIENAMKAFLISEIFSYIKNSNNNDNGNDSDDDDDDDERNDHNNDDCDDYVTS
jgi:hypothetical protein